MKRYFPARPATRGFDCRALASRLLLKDRMLRAARAAAAAFAMAILCVSVTEAERRGIFFDRYTVDDGLAQSAVNAVVQDPDGFIWLGTQEGLQRFDGFEFQYFEQTESPDSLSNSWVWALLVDSRGSMWVGTEGGLSKWEPETESFRRFQLDSSNPTTLSNDDVRALFEDSNGRIWAGTDGGLNMLLEEEAGTFRRFTHNVSKERSLSSDAVRTVLEDSSGTLWVGTDGGGLNRLDPELGGFVHYRHDENDPTSLASDKVRCLYEDKDGNLWIGTEGGGLNRYNRDTATFESFDLADAAAEDKGKVRWITQDAEDGVWVGTASGLWEWLPRTDRFRRYSYSPTDPSSLAGDNVMSIFQDRGGVIWVGTMKGLSKWNPTTSTFGAFTASDPPGERLSDNNIFSLAEGPDGDIWAGTYGAGLNRIDRETGRIRHYRHDVNKPGSLGDDTAPTLYFDSRGRLWIGTHKSGLFRYDAARELFINYRHDPNDPSSLSGNAVTSIYEDGEGQFWVGIYGGGLNNFNPETGRAVHYRHDPTSGTSLSHDNVIDIEEDSQGVLWIGTHGGGLSGMDRETGRFARFGGNKSLASKELASHLSSKVWALKEDRSGNLWIGTGDEGLYVWSREDRENYRPAFQHYQQRDGLANDSINAILEDGSGNLWLSTNQGLSRFDPATRRFRNFDLSNGLLSKEFNQGAALVTRSGEMFFGGNEGISFFDPATIQTNTHEPPVVLTSLLLNNEHAELDQPLSDIQGITLQYTDYVVSFEFASLDYTAPEENEYAYKLEGFDDDWVEARNRFASYTNLDPGSYTFRVKASNNDGLWNQDGLAVIVEVAPPPWKTWWAYTAYALMATSLAFAYARAQAQKLEKEAEYSRKLEREVQTRTRELAERNSDLEQANNKLQQASFTDSLTGLRNRRYLMSTISDDIALVDRYYHDLNASSGAPAGKRPDFLFMIFDLDGFKEVNDTFGHAAGDQVLVQVKEILEGACRSSDTVIRWGGDEFLIVGRYADRRAAEVLSDRIRNGIDNHAFQLGGDIEARLSCSIGFAYYPFAKAAPRLMNWEQVVAIADRALYIAKNSGRNAWVGVQETSKTADLPPEALAAQVNDRIDRLVADGYLDLHSSIDDEQELVWAWG